MPNPGIFWFGALCSPVFLLLPFLSVCVWLCAERRCVYIAMFDFFHLLSVNPEGRVGLDRVTRGVTWEIRQGLLKSSPKMILTKNPCVHFKVFPTKKTLELWNSLWNDAVVWAGPAWAQRALHSLSHPFSHCSFVQHLFTKQGWND